MFKTLKNGLRGRMRRDVRTTAIILAGGESSRMGGGSKQFMLLCGAPILAHTLKAFQNCRNIDDIIIVAKHGEEAGCLSICKEFGISKLLKIVTGGPTRQASAMNGFKAVPFESKYVAFHDGARPLVTKKEISDVIFAARENGCAVAGAVSKDTVKIARDDGCVDKTLDRSKVWLVQTPQVFYKTLYEGVSALAERDGFTATDDASLAEHYSHKVKLVACSPNNIKITFPSDIAFAESVLARRSEDD